MAYVKVLVEGYLNTDDFGVNTICPTISLVRDRDFVIVVDPGILKNQNILIKSLKEENLSVEDVNAVFITHSHIDHYKNIGLFPNAEIIEYYGIWNENTFRDRKNHITDDIEIIETPGHNYTSLTLLVNTKLGKVAVCGDVFWKQNYPESDPYADDEDKLKESRKKILRIADYIVPGHAKMYKV